MNEVSLLLVFLVLYQVVIVGMFYHLIMVYKKHSRIVGGFHKYLKQLDKKLSEHDNRIVKRVKALLNR